jgi:hypothetical protein
MTMQTDELEVQEQESPGEGQPEASTPTAEESANREKELRDRLAAQGRTLAEMRRTNEQLAAQLAETNASVKLLGENMTAQQRAEEERTKRQQRAYLDSLPEDQRLREEVRLANERVERLEAQMSGRNGGSQTHTSGSPRPQPRRETPQEYQTRRMREIISQAEGEFGVAITREELEAIPEDKWDQESTFHAAVFATAARKQAAGSKAAATTEEKEDVAGKGKAAPKAAPAATQTPADMKEQARREVLRELGISSPASPRAAATRRNGPPPSEEDVREAVSTYDSAQGPKANIKRLREIRGQMNG